VFPLLPLYMVWGTFIEQPLTFFSWVPLLIPINLEQFPSTAITFIAVILMSLVILPKKPHFSLLGGISLAIITFLSFPNAPQFFSRFVISSLPFILLSWVTWIEFVSTKKPGRIFICSFICLFLIYPGFYREPHFLDEKTSEINYLTGVIYSELQLIPSFDGDFLVEGNARSINNFFKLYAPQIDIDHLDILDYGSGAVTHHSVDYAPRLKELLGGSIVDDSPVSLIDTYTPLTQDEQRVKINIEKNKYDIILLGPMTGFFSIPRIIMNSTRHPSYCEVYLPDLSYPTFRARHHTVLYFKEKQSCSAMKKGLKSYFDANFDEICMKDEWVSNEVITLIAYRFNNMQPPYICTSDQHLIEEDISLLEKTDNPLQIKSIGLLLIAFLAVYFFKVDRLLLKY
ncbi:MAG: hypothetical protein ABH950_03360, partial [Candidatus Altiarchaeota archaeon]